MAEQVDKRDLGYLGEEFQYRLIHHFMSYPDFFIDLERIVDQNMFTHAVLRTFVAIMKDHVAKHEVVPSYDVMEIEFRERTRNRIDLEIALETVERIKNTVEDDCDYIKDLAFKFFRQQNIVKAANEVLGIASKGNTEQYEHVVDVLSDALTQGVHEDNGTTVFADLSTTLSDDYRFSIPTGISDIDDVLEGGIAKGELGVIVGPSSFGKTSLTTALANHAATYVNEERGITDGLKVLQIVFEDRETQIRRKHIARIATLESGEPIEARNLSKPGYREKVLRILSTYQKKDMLDNNLRIVRFQSGEKTAMQIKKFVKRLINTGFKPDLMIVDYFECLRHVGDKTDGEYTKEGITMRKFESMANELDMAIWIPVQGTKDSFNKEILGLSDAGGSGKKVQIGHIIMTIARTPTDIEQGIATISIPKNRSGRGGATFTDISFNNGTCIVDCNGSQEYNVVSYNQSKQKENNDIAKDIMRRMKMNASK